MIRPWSQRVPLSDQGLRRTVAKIQHGAERVRIEIRHRGAVSARFSAEAEGVKRGRWHSKRAPSNTLSVSQYQDYLDDADLTEDQKDYYMAVFRQYKQDHSGEELVNLRSHRGY